MSFRRSLPSQVELWRVFSLDCETGVLTWKYRPEMEPKWNGRFSGQCAGSGAGMRRYRTVCVNGTAYLQHRLIWKMLFDEEPDVIDHIDGDPANNSWRNLRPATQTENLGNRRRRLGKHLPKGVGTTRAGKFRATIAFNRQRFNLGHFQTIEEAQAAYASKAEELYGEFARMD
jgi:hypothetical protein